MQEAALITLPLPLCLNKKPWSYYRLIKGPEKYYSGVSSSRAFMCLCIIDRSHEAERLDHHCGRSCTWLRGWFSVTKVIFKLVFSYLIHCHVNLYQFLITKTVLYKQYLCWFPHYFPHMNNPAPRETMYMWIIVKQRCTECFLQPILILCMINWDTAKHQTIQSVCYYATISHTYTYLEWILE